MKTLIYELQEKILDKSLPVSETLRFALLVAKKLKLSDFEKWINAELNGYHGTIEIPSYRLLSCKLKGWNHIRREWEPITTPNKPESYSRCSIGQSIGEIEHVLARNKSQNGTLTVPFSNQEEAQIIKNISNRRPSEVTLIVDHGHVYGIVDKVKTLILRWALDLECAGILGESMAFTEKEKESARTVSITNNNYCAEVQTVIQSSQNPQVQLGGRGTTQSLINESLDLDAISKIVEEFKKGIHSLNLTPSQKSEAEADIQTLTAQSTSSNPKKSIIKEALHSLRVILENASGEIIAASLLAALSKIDI